jgi:uncharacterized Fe-S cluster-containing radical SAM superfamily protein
MDADTKIWGDYFRPREYIKPREYTSKLTEYWFKASLDEIWSSKFIGLDENGIKKLEFQNPAYVAAYRLGGDPREYNSVFTIQVGGCNYRCSFCYVPRNANNPMIAPSRLFSAREILDAFEKIRKDQDKKIKVIRLSGGEVTSIVPEMIIDINDEINRRGLSEEIYLFSDCNLSTIEFVRCLKSEFRAIARQKNFGMIGCLKAVGDGNIGKEDFTLITGASPEFFENQFKAIDFYVNEIQVDFYLYLLPTVFGSQEEVRMKLNACLNRLREINVNLPLRVNILHIALERYKATIENLKEAEKEGRKLPNFDERFILRIWYEEMLPKVYPSSMLKKYKCQIPLKSEG